MFKSLNHFENLARNSKTYSEKTARSQEMQSKHLYLIFFLSLLIIEFFKFSWRSIMRIGANGCNFEKIPSQIQQNNMGHKVKHPSEALSSLRTNETSGIDFSQIFSKISRGFEAFYRFFCSHFFSLFCCGYDPSRYHSSSYKCEEIYLGTHQNDVDKKKAKDDLINEVVQNGQSRWGGAQNNAKKFLKKVDSLVIKAHQFIDRNGFSSNNFIVNIKCIESGMSRANFICTQQKIKQSYFGFLNTEKKANKNALSRKKLLEKLLLFFRTNPECKINVTCTGYAFSRFNPIRYFHQTIGAEFLYEDGGNHKNLETSSEITRHFHLSDVQSKFKKAVSAMQKTGNPIKKKGG